MGPLTLFAHRMFAEETERITGGAAGWQAPPEIRFELENVQSDGLLVIRRPRLLERLVAPWPAARTPGEIMLELRLAGTPLDRPAVERVLLKRQARQVQRIEEQDPAWLGEESLWIVAPHLPAWLVELRRPVRFAPGCYWIEPQWQRYMWIAANELPLVDELVPFLMARSGQMLDDFVRWSAPRRPIEWMLTMLEYMPMSLPTREELLQRFGKVDDPEIEARRQHILKVLLESSPQTKQELIDQGLVKGQLLGARTALRRLFARRQLTPNQVEDTRIEACTDLPTLERWHDQAITAPTVADALE
jgi:hypothetical protein